MCLLYDVARVEHFTFVVYAGGAADVEMVAVALLQHHAAFEGHAILICGVEMGGGVEVSLL